MWGSGTLTGLVVTTSWAARRAFVTGGQGTPTIAKGVLSPNQHTHGFHARYGFGGYER
ncbi:hypothetical protein QE435_003755 [Rhizobium sp. SORGH_AS 787]|nr:hypothetical protein [Rhizobium sp. SORGH_AS_0787]